MCIPSAGAITVREHVLLELARRDKSDLGKTLQAITEAAAVVLDVARVSIWEICDGHADEDENDTRLICKDLYLSSEGRHTSYLPIHSRDFPSYLHAIHERRTIAADDAQADPRTCEFKELYLKPLGITSMMDVPIWHDGQVYGVLCLEHVGPIRQWRANEQSFAIHMADIASLSLEAAELLTLRKRWDIVVDSMEEGVAVIDSQGTAIQYNRAALRDFGGRTECATLDGRIARSEYVDATDRPIPLQDWPFFRCMRGEIIRGEICGFVVKETGEHRYLRLTCSPVAEDGALKYVVAVGVDITEEVFLERLKRELLAGLAHELKTPLAIAKGYAQQLRSSTSVPATWHRMLDAITQACDRMDHLSETLLDLSSMILGRLRLTRERIDLVDLARAVVRRTEQDAPDHRFQFEVHDGPPAPVIVDGLRVSQALRQIIENAVAFSDPGTSIEIELSTDERQVTLSVRDHGIGIPAAAQPNIFRMFFKAHAGGEHDTGGLGVGLYLAREIVRRHGGEIYFQSVEGEGSTFYLQLPLAEES